MEEICFTILGTIAIHLILGVLIAWIAVEAKDADKDFAKAVNVLKKELENNCYNGDLDEEDES